MGFDKKNKFKLIISVGFLVITLLLNYVKNAGYSSTDISFYDNLLLMPFFILFAGILILYLNRYDVVIKNDLFLNNVFRYYLLFSIIIISQLWIIKYGTVSEIDSWIHIKRIEECIDGYNISVKTNFYPLLTLLFSEISIITETDPKMVYVYFPFFHIFCYTLIMLSLMKVYANQFEKILPYGTIFLIILINPISLKDSYIVPWALNYLFIILYIYLLQKYIINRSTENLCLLVLCLFPLTFTHILGIIYILTSTIFMIIFEKLMRPCFTKSTIPRLSINKNHIVLMSVIVLSWIFTITDAANNQLLIILEKIPDILYGTSTAQQKIATSKSFSHFILSWLNLISNMFLVALSISYITYEIIQAKKHKLLDSSFESKYFALNFVFSGFILFIIIRYLTGKTEYSGISMRYLCYTAIVYPIMIYYLYLKLSTHNININKISVILLLIFVGSTLTIYSRPGYENSSPIITDSLYEGIEWGNDKIIYDENTKLITGGDFVYQYLYYTVGYKKCNDILEGSTKGMLYYCDYNPEIYKYRQESNTFSVKKDNAVYLYYYSLMDRYIAYSKHENKNIGVSEQLLNDKKNNKIYDSFGFIVFDLRESEIDKLKEYVDQTIENSSVSKETVDSSFNTSSQR